MGETVSERVKSGGKTHSRLSVRQLRCCPRMARQVNPRARSGQTREKRVGSGKVNAKLVVRSRSEALQEVDEWMRFGDKVNPHAFNRAGAVLVRTSVPRRQRRG